MEYSQSQTASNYMSKETTTPPRKRTRATPEQLSILEKTFTINQSPNSRIREQLSRELGMSERSIQIWFQNRRAKVKNIAKRSSMLHSETLRMQYDAANAAAAACQAALFQQNPMAVEDPVKSNPDLYYYYYYYYYNQQKQKHLMPFKSASIPPPPPPPPPHAVASTAGHGELERKNRFRAHTVGPYTPYQKPSFPRASSVDIQLTNETMLNNNLLMNDNPFLSFQQQMNSPWTDIPPFYDDTSTPVDDQQTLSVEALQIGSWKRMKFDPKDLTCVFDKQRSMFIWCIQDGASRFKMEFHQDAVQSITLVPNQIRPRLEFGVLPQQISFYMDNGQHQWVQCRDFTEDRQASVITFHQLDGPLLLLKSELQQLAQENTRVASVYK
ncbi:hypothetical protein G6F62_001388 [Rhizopus arrhizus]|uniref:Homeobox domain-containing protein n=1 Tax=Rhizopus oryzae TaxID=64495 RepID=A0A9P7BXW5_RHIOR|nr:hypothetical protein G6F23_000674 [Rhizopus arrhizus]KAG0770004.1 hypothetical protein G6F24_000583 [Rhizopus arrhizus]KAG0775862.1 hypothetical protein G6F22_012990 [Rhizopus arrhizus]KAG0796763.1 hypothetical protein G6F21_001042 [Rhizopus arrhizus]KAG0818584.1 hypothetical protein G6F20_001462 [Rhizopus arrhizus]